MNPAANIYFPRILADKKNSAVLQEAVEIDGLREEVVACLERIEKEDAGEPWWKGTQLMSIFEAVFQSGCILLPRDPVQRLRWIALLCVEISKREGFSCGNIIIAPDYVPDKELGLYEDIYGISVIEDIKDIRRKLSQVGWDKAFAE